MPQEMLYMIMAVCCFQDQIYQLLDVFQNQLSLHNENCSSNKKMAWPPDFDLIRQAILSKITDEQSAVDRGEGMRGGERRGEERRGEERRGGEEGRGKKDRCDVIVAGLVTS